MSRLAVAAPRALARVDLGAVTRNCEHLLGLLTEGSVLCAVVKADAYGHGEVECARAALRGGATWLAVATPGEAARLRAAGLDAPILVMGALAQRELEEAVDAGADVVAWDPAFVAAAGIAARRAGREVGVHVKLDTGMGRLGARDPVAARAVADLAAGEQGLELRGVMTHFATADEPGDELFVAQLDAFTEFVDQMKAEHPELVAHAANSAAVYRDPAAHFDLARCGIAIYGLDPMNEDPAPRALEPALSLHTRVALIKRFEAGEGAGYGRRWTAAEPTWVAVLPIGYADGVRRGLTNNADVLVRGRRHPLVGTVSMDMVTVDLGPDTDVRVGDEAVLIGRQGEDRILCEEVACRLDTINYEVTCGLGGRVERVHVGA